MIAGLASVELLDSCKNAEATDVKSEALAEGCVTSDIASDIASDKDRSNADLLSTALLPADCNYYVKNCKSEHEAPDPILNEFFLRIAIAQKENPDKDE